MANETTKTPRASTNAGAGKAAGGKAAAPRKRKAGKGRGATEKK